MVHHTGTRTVVALANLQVQLCMLCQAGPGRAVLLRAPPTLVLQVACGVVACWAVLCYAALRQVMGEAVQLVLDVRAASAVDLQLLYLLSKHAPRDAAKLLAGIPLTPVQLDDNVLPFQLPARGFSAVGASHLSGDMFRHEHTRDGVLDAKFFSDQEEEDASITSSLLALGRTWVAYSLAFSSTVSRRSAGAGAGGGAGAAAGAGQRCGLGCRG